jgi:acetyltransferase-like isoleucine patch superfamily enzyme
MPTIHPTADVQSADIGEGTTVWQFCVILPQARIGEGCNINCHCFIENDVVIGHRVTVKSGVYLWDGVELEDDVFIGPNATFVNNLYPRSKQYPEKNLRTLVRKGASVGAGATLLGGIEIGEGALIGAGSVVTKNVPPHTKWFGNPARNMGPV